MKPRSFPKGSLIARRFQLQEVVASGGMGSVFRAHDLKRDEQVALKLLFSRHLEASLRFEREVQILQEIHHPGIVRYISHGTHETGQLYLVMEWLEGEDLSQRMAREPLTVRETIELGVAAASALEAAHVRGIIHRVLRDSQVQPGVLSGAALSWRRFGKSAEKRTVTPCGVGTYLSWKSPSASSTSLPFKSCTICARYWRPTRKPSSGESRTLAETLPPALTVT